MQNLTVKLTCNDVTKRVRAAPENFEALKNAVKAQMCKSNGAVAPGEDFEITYEDDTGDVINVSDDEDLLSAYDCAKDMSNHLRFSIKARKAIAPQPVKVFAKEDDQIVELNAEVFKKAIQDLVNNKVSVDQNDADSDQEGEGLADKKQAIKKYGISKACFQKLVKKEMNKHCDQIFEKMMTRKDLEAEDVDQICSKAKYEHNINCDGCGHSITDIRYKCTVCKNLDFCPMCEERLEHPHAFLKIYKKEQVPTAMFTVIDENLPDAHADIEQDVNDGPLPEMFGGANHQQPAAVNDLFGDDEDVDLYS